MKKVSETGFSARWFRDLICINGVLKFVEMEQCFKEVEKPINPSDNEILLYSDLIMSLRHKNMDEKEKSREGWRAMIWTRTFHSHCWSKRCAADVNDMVCETICTLPDTGRGIRSQFRDMLYAFPTLCPDGDDRLYMLMAEPNEKKNAWVFSADLVNKTIGVVGVYSIEASDPSIPFFTCLYIVWPSEHQSRH